MKLQGYRRLLVIALVLLVCIGLKLDGPHLRDVLLAALATFGGPDLVEKSKWGKGEAPK